MRLFLKLQPKIANRGIAFSLLPQGIGSNYWKNYATKKPANPEVIWMANTGMNDEKPNHFETIIRKLTNTGRKIKKKIPLLLTVSNHVRKKVHKTHSKIKFRKMVIFLQKLTRPPTEPPSLKHPAAPPLLGHHPTPAVLSECTEALIVFLDDWKHRWPSGGSAAAPGGQGTASTSSSCTPQRHATHYTGKEEGSGSCRYGLLHRLFTTKTAPPLAVRRCSANSNGVLRDTEFKDGKKYISIIMLY